MCFLKELRGGACFAYMDSSITVIPGRKFYCGISLSKKGNQNTQRTSKQSAQGTCDALVTQSLTINRHVSFSLY